MGPNRRSFTVVASSASGQIGGRFISSTPYGAARKAAKGLFEILREGHMQIQEITRGSAGRIYSYAAIIEHNTKVVTFKKADGKTAEIRRKFITRVTKLTETEYVTLGSSPSAARVIIAARSPSRRVVPDSSDDGSDVSSTDSDVSDDDVMPAQRGGYNYWA